MTIRAKLIAALCVAGVIWTGAAGLVVHLQGRLNDLSRRQDAERAVEREITAYNNAMREASIGVSLVSANSVGPGMAYIVEGRQTLEHLKEAEWQHPALTEVELGNLKEIGTRFLLTLDRALDDYQVRTALEVERKLDTPEGERATQAMSLELTRARRLLEVANLKLVHFDEVLENHRAVESARAIEMREQVTAVTAISAIVALIAGIVPVALVTTSLRRRLAAVGQAAHEFGNGNLRARASEQGADEISGLGSQFNSLAAALEQSTNHLNETVAIRTRDLEQAVATLGERNREVEDFAYAASHDLREPLRTIMGFAELMEMDLPADSSEEVKEGLQVILGAGRRMQTLVSDLLDLSRSGRQQMHFVPTDLNDLLREARAQLSATISQSKAKVTVHELPTVRADGAMLLRVFMNLVGNGIKYQPRGQTAVIDVGFTDGGDHWDIRIADNGIGIAPQYHAVVFEPFKRLHRQDEYEGSGIGLAVCRRTIERHGGKIRLESEPGKGSTFIIALPKVLTDSTRLAQVAAAAA